MIGLEWEDIDLNRKVIHVRRQVRHGRVDVPKNGKPRTVGIQNALLPILVAHQAATGSKGIIFKPTFTGRGGTKQQPARYIGSGTLSEYLDKALVELGIDSNLTWYQATRHTFASHYMMAGGDLAKLKDEMGHADIKTTMRYAKLSPDYRTEKDRALLALPTVELGAIGSKIGSIDAPAEAEVEAKATN